MEPMQLHVFEKATPESPWKYLSTYKAADQRERITSKHHIGDLHAALHKGDGVSWAVVAQPDEIKYLFSLSHIGRRNGLHPRKEGKTFKSLDGLGELVLLLPDLPDDDHCPVCGSLLAGTSPRTCTVCQWSEDPHPKDKLEDTLERLRQAMGKTNEPGEWTGEQILEREA